MVVDHNDKRISVSEVVNSYFLNYIKARQEGEEGVILLCRLYKSVQLRKKLYMYLAM
jgi:hypothetical protein